MNEVGKYNPENKLEGNKEELLNKIHKILFSEKEAQMMKNILTSFNFSMNYTSGVDYMIEETRGDIEEFMIGCNDLDWLNFFLNSSSLRRTVYHNKIVDIFRNESKRPKLREISFSSNQEGNGEDNRDAVPEIPLDDNNFGNVEAWHDLSRILAKIKDGQDREIFKIIILGITIGFTAEEIVGQLFNKKLTDHQLDPSRISQIYNNIVESDLIKEFPNFPRRISDLRRSVWGDSSKKSEKINRDREVAKKEMQNILAEYRQAKNQTDDEFITDKINYLEFILGQADQLNENFYFLKGDRNGRYVEKIKKLILADSGMGYLPNLRSDDNDFLDGDDVEDGEEI
ncbi:MAG: hypothetical protein WCX97_01130 [Candidatus Magasanikbacteria bacterium]